MNGAGSRARAPAGPPTAATARTIHPHLLRPRYGSRKDFVHGEGVTIAGWTVSAEGLPRYA